MRLSPAAELAIRGTCVLAQRYGEGPVTLQTVAETRSLSRQYLAKLFLQLAKADLVTAIRGKNGGYVLARDPSQITLLEIIEAVEGPLAMNFCQHDPPKCEEYDCPLRPVWTEIQEFVRDRLGRVTLDQAVSCAGE